MSMAKRILIFGCGGLTVGHAVSVTDGRPIWWWIALSYAAFGALALCAHLRKWA